MLHYTSNMTTTISTCISYRIRFYHVLVMGQLVDASGVGKGLHVMNRTADRWTVGRDEELTQHTVYLTRSDRGVILQDWVETALMYGV